jgi:hypothetical protein
MNNIIKKGVFVTKVLVWNRTGNESYDESSECQITFSDGSKIRYECDEVDVLVDQNIGIYELLEDGTYTQIEDWQ